MIIIWPNGTAAVAATAAAADDVSQVLNTNVPINYPSLSLSLCACVCLCIRGLGLEKGSEIIFVWFGANVDDTI